MNGTKTRILSKALLFLLGSLISTNGAYASETSDVSVSTTAATPPQSHPFKKIGSFLSSNVLGVDVPVKEDENKNEPATSPPQPPPSSASGSQELTRSEIDDELHRQSRGGPLEGQMAKQDASLANLAKHTRLPKNAAESAELDQLARDKGYGACVYWMHPLDGGVAGLRAKERKTVEDAYRLEMNNEAKGIRMGGLGPDKALWRCRSDVMETKYQLAKASGDPAKIKAASDEYKAFAHQLDAK
jgi:hypothetical protein